MPYILWNARYIPPDERKRADNLRSDMRYGATREGVDRLDKDLRPRAMSGKEGLEYIARRRGAAAFELDGDGLFNAEGKADLAAEVRLLQAHTDSVEWRFVLSFEKQQLQESGYDDPKALQQLLAAKMPEIARLHRISPEHMVWNAAYHPVDKQGRDHHPHVHIYLYSTDPSEGLATREQTQSALEKGRSIFTHAVFSEQMEALRQQQKEARQLLRETAEAVMTEPDWAERCGIQRELQVLRTQLPRKGKVVYGYLPKETKLAVDHILRRLVKEPVFSAAYARLQRAQRDYLEAYNDDPEKIAQRMAEWEKHFFHPTGQNDKAVLHNTLIRFALQESDDYLERLSMEAQKGDAVAMAKLGRLMLPTLPKEGRKLLEIAAHKGAISAEYPLGQLEEKAGNGREAIRHYEKAAQNKDFYAMYRLGRLYDRGKLVTADAGMAYIWYGKAAERGHLWATVRMAELCAEFHESEEATRYREQASYLLAYPQEHYYPDTALVLRLARLYATQQEYTDAILHYGELLFAEDDHTRKEAARGLIQIRHDPAAQLKIAELEEGGRAAANQILEYAATLIPPVVDTAKMPPDPQTTFTQPDRRQSIDRCVRSCVLSVSVMIGQLIADTVAAKQQQQRRLQKRTVSRQPGVTRSVVPDEEESEAEPTANP